MEHKKVSGSNTNGNRCSILNCRKSRRDIPGLRIFVVPRLNEDLRSLWVAKCGLNERGSNLHVCERHFEKSFIGKTRLKHDAVPTLLLPSCTSQYQHLQLSPKLSENDSDKFADELTTTHSEIIETSQSSIEGNSQTETIMIMDREKDPDIPEINETKLRRLKNPNGIDEKSIKIKVTTMISKRIMELDKLLMDILRDSVSIGEQQLLLQYNERPDFPSLQWFEPTSNSTTDLEQTCRVCVRSMTRLEKRVSLFLDTTGNNLNTIFRELNRMDLKIYRDDGLPQNICAPCATRLEQLKEFRLQAVRAQYILQAYFDRIVKTNDLDDTIDPNQHTEDIGFEFLKVEPIDMLDSSQLNLPLENTGINKFLYESHVDDSNDKIIDISEFEIVNSINDFKFKCNDCEETFQEYRKLLNHKKICEKPNSELAPAPNISSPVDLVEEQGNDDDSCSNEINSIQSTESVAYEPSEKNQKKGKKPKKKKKRPTRVKNKNDQRSNYRFTRRCGICSQWFPSFAERNEHMLIHNEGKPQCKKCDCNFEMKSDLTVHYNEVHPSPLICPTCNRIFKRTDQLYTHVTQSHNAPRKYKCQYCDKRFVQSHHLKNHEATHSGARNFLCATCGKSFQSDGMFSQHRKLCDPSHKLYNSIVCEHCGKSFSSKLMLTQHVRSYTGEKPFVCDLCDQRFAQKVSLNRHIMKDHVQIYKTKGESTGESEGIATIALQPYQYKCKVCNQRFRLQPTLTKHLKCHANEEERKYVCEICKQTFKRSAHLHIHINGVHLRLKNYKCDMCEKTFHNRGNLNEHIIVAHKERKYECAECGKILNSGRTLRQHMRIHTGEKPNGCDVCGVRFTTYTALKSHMTKKEGEMCAARMKPLPDSFIDE